MVIGGTSGGSSHNVFAPANGAVTAKSSIVTIIVTNDLLSLFFIKLFLLVTLHCRSSTQKVTVKRHLFLKNV